MATLKASPRVPAPPGRLPLLALLLVALAGAALLAFADALSLLQRYVAAAGLSVAGCGLAALVLRRWSATAQPLLDNVRALATGRADARVPEGLGGFGDALGGEINRLGHQLAELRTRFDDQIGRASHRLRQERDQANEQLQQLRASASQWQSEVRAQSELWSSLSHELRTPLTGILGYAELLRRSGLNPEQAQQLDILDKSARALLAMINDLLDWSRIEAGRLRLNEDSFDLYDVVEDTLSLLAPMAYDKDLELVRIIYHDVPQRLRGDPQRLRQILTNLLSNAIKFTENGEVVLRVMQEREASGRTWLRCSVTDTGVGISADQQARLFQPFRQVGRPNASAGSGLGLSITRKLCELMGGEISLESTPGRGSTFSVLLPFKLAADAAAVRAHDERLAEHTLWLHEPHATARLALVHWLEFWGLRVRSSSTAAELADAVRNAGGAQRPDLVLIGLKPRATVDPAIRELLSLCRSQEPPLLALVASAALPVHETLRAAGAAACHPKCISRQRLHDELLRLLLPRDVAGSDKPLARQRAVVADNNAFNRRWLATLASNLGLEVTSTANGREALESWQRLRPQVVLLDARMPEISGAECARAIRNAEAVAGGDRCRIVAVSAHLEPDERKAFLDAGADGILIKPFNETELLRALSTEVPAATAPAARLVADPELLALLSEELPKQYEDLERALAAGELEPAREAAHTLRGTAAFYHLASLRQTTAALEEWLRRTTQLQQGPAIRRELEGVRRAVDDTLRAINR